MSLRSISELLVQLDKFRNIDLKSQGYYKIKICLYFIYEPAENNMIKFYFPPCGFSEYKEDEINKNYLHHSIAPAKLLKGNIYSSKVFQIKFCDETVDICEMIKFRIENDIFKPLKDEFYLEFTLLYADLSFYGDLDNEVPSSYLEVDNIYKPISSRTFLLKDLNSMKFIYIPVIFDDYFYAICNTSLHFSLIEFKLKPQLLISQNSDESIYIVNSNNAQKEGKKSVEQKNTLDYIDLPSLQNYLYNIIVSKKIFNFPVDFDKSISQKIHSLTIKQFDNSIEIIKLNGIEIMKLIVSKEEIKQEENSSPQFNLKPHDEKNSIAQNVKNVTFSQEEFKEILKMEGENKIENKNENNNNNLIVPNKLETENSFDNNLIYSQELEKEIYAKTNSIKELWNIYSEHVSELGNKIVKYSTSKYMYDFNKFISYFIFSEKVKENEFMNFNPGMKKDKYSTQAKIIRSSGSFYQKFFDLDRNGSDLHLFNTISDVPLFFEEIIEWNKPEKDSISRYSLIFNSNQSIHFFVLVHGYKGSSFDLRLIRNNIMLLFPEALFMLSDSNEKDTEDDIEKMGLNLANEIKDYISTNFTKNSLKCINFIGHSLGGIIIRASLRHLEDYKDKFNTLITFSTPHLGLMFSESAITSTGFWIMQKWNNVLSLSQLSMKETKDRKTSFLYKLSDYPSFEWFQNIILIGSGQDSYCHYESGRIEISKEVLTSKERGPYYIEMIKKLKSKLVNKNVITLDINFKINKT